MKRQYVTKSVFDFIKPVMQPVLDRKGLYLSKVIEDWHLIVPENYVSLVSPAGIKWVNNQGILILYSKNNVTKQLILHDTPHIIDKINAYFGYKAIIKIKFA